MSKICWFWPLVVEARMIGKLANEQQESSSHTFGFLQLQPSNQSQIWHRAKTEGLKYPRHVKGDSPSYSVRMAVQLRFR